MTEETTVVKAPLFPRLVVRAGGQLIREVVLHELLTIGRAEDNDLKLIDPKVSRHHARLTREGDDYILTDLDSANGTWVNRVRLTAPHRLAHGDQIGVGDAELIFLEPGRSWQEVVTLVEPLPAGWETRVGPPVLSVPAPPAAAGGQAGNRSKRLVALALIGVGLVAMVALLVILFVAPGPLGRGRPVGGATPTVPVEASPTSAGAERPIVAQPTPEPATPTAGTIPEAEMSEWLTQAGAFARRSKFEEAITIYEDLVRRAPADARPEIGWAWALILDDRAEEALSHAQRAMELDPTSAEVATVLARVYLELGKVQEALTAAQQAVQQNPTSAQAHAVLADAYMRNGQVQDAVQEADLALVQDISQADARRVRGWLYYLADQDIGRAAGELQAAAGLQPELWVYRHQLGEFLYEVQDYTTALLAFQDALRLRPKARTYTAIGLVYYQLERYDQARVSAEQALAAGAQDADCYALLAVLYARGGRCDEAQPYYKQALALEATHPLALEAQELCPTAEATPSTLPSPPAPGPTPKAGQPTATARPGPSPAPMAELSGWIAFPVWNAERGKYDTYVAQARDGSGRHLVVEEMHQPAFSPDGNWLVVNGERREHLNLFLVKPDGSQLREISKHIEDGLPCWAPDGKRLAFSSTMHGDRQSRVYIMDEVPFVGGKVQGRALNFGPDDVRGEYPAWTSDDRIVYKGCDVTVDPAPCGLFIMSARPGPQPFTQLTDHPGDTAPAVYGNRIAFTSNRDGNWEIYLINDDGSDLRRLTNNPAMDGLPTWSPDGKFIAFVSNQGGGWAIWVMAADGSGRRKLFDLGGGGLASDWLHERISWGP